MSDKNEPQIAFRLFLRNEERNLKIEAEKPDLTNASWIPAAKVGQVVNVKEKLHSITAESLESSIGTWKGRKIFKNHETEIKNHIILDEKFENPFLSFLLDTEIVAALDKGGGGSIDAIATLVEEGKILTLSGVGYSVLDKDKMPACTKEAGCGLAAEGAGEKKDEGVNIEGDITNPNIKLDVNKTEEKKKEIMTNGKDEKVEVTFSEEQMATLKAEAVTNITDQMTASHKVAITDLEKVHADEIKTLSETHIADLETQRLDVQKHIEMVESLSTKFMLSPEAKKTLVDAKTPEDIYALLATLKVEKAEPVIAAEGGATIGCGIVLGNEVEGETPETIQIEEVGTWDPYKNEYIPSYRTELK